MNPSRKEVNSIKNNNYSSKKRKKFPALNWAALATAAGALSTGMAGVQLGGVSHEWMQQDSGAPSLLQGIAKLIEVLRR